MIRVVAVGKIKERYLAEALAEYAKRIARYDRLELVELSESRAGAAEARAQEGRKILARLRPGESVVALDAGGREMSTEEFARDLAKRRERNTLTYIIGGPEGLDAALLARCDLSLSLSMLTLPHRLARLVLYEQIYRALTISAGHPYHR